MSPTRKQNQRDIIREESGRDQREHAGPEQIAARSAPDRPTRHPRTNQKLAERPSADSCHQIGRQKGPETRGRFCSNPKTPCLTRNRSNHSGHQNQYGSRENAQHDAPGLPVPQQVALHFTGGRRCRSRRTRHGPSGCTPILGSGDGFGGVVSARHARAQYPQHRRKNERWAPTAESPVQITRRGRGLPQPPRYEEPLSNKATARRAPWRETTSETAWSHLASWRPPRPQQETKNAKTPPGPARWRSNWRLRCRSDAPRQATARTDSVEHGARTGLHDRIGHAEMRSEYGEFVLAAVFLLEDRRQNTQSLPVDKMTHRRSKRAARLSTAQMADRLNTAPAQRLHLQPLDVIPHGGGRSNPSTGTGLPCGIAASKRSREVI